MKRMIGIVILVGLLFALAGCGKADVEYYCTEVILKDLSLGDVTRTVYTYDSDWNTAQVITYLNEDEISFTDYVYSGDRVTVTTVYGELTEVVEIENTKDEQGNILRSVQSIAGGTVCTTDNTYDADGRLTKTRSDYGDGFISITEYTYDERGELLSETVCQEGFGILTRRECETASDGSQTIRVLDPDGALTGYYLAFPDEAGNILQQEYYDPAGNLLSITLCTYQGSDGSISTGVSG